MVDRVHAADWPAIETELNSYGCGPVGRILTSQQCRQISRMYDHADHFRSTIDMARYRFGSGQYRYFDYPLPDLVSELRHAFYPYLLPIARDWAEKLHKPAPWPDDLDEWLAMCHAAGQPRSTPILLRYRENDWNALHRDLYGDLVFPLQVVIGLDRPGLGPHRRRVPAARTAAAGPVPGHRDRPGTGPRAGLHHPRPPRPVRPRLVDRARTTRREHRPFRRPAHPRPGLSRRRLTSGLCRAPQSVPTRVTTPRTNAA